VNQRITPETPGDPSPEDQIIDVIVVPAWRSVAGLTPAIKLARITSSQLVVLCSGKATACEVAALASVDGVKGVALDIPRGYRHPLFDFASSTHAAVQDAGFTDVRIKRNVGLSLARMNGWQRLLFLDDDHRLSVDQVQRAGRALRTHRISCFYAEDFPDNSVVRHAERLAGGHPTVSLSIGSAAVRIGTDMTFFPEVYNEDWLFLYDSIPSDAVAIGAVRQLPYDPFADPARAVSEEFGDVLAEGLVQFKNAGLSATDTTEDDWAAILEERARLIRDILGQLRTREAGDPTITSALRALQAAENRLADISAQSLKSYVGAWRHDVEAWRERMESLMQSASVEAAVQFLGLDQGAQYFHAWTAPTRLGDSSCVSRCRSPVSSCCLSNLERSGP
jgi:hypothetical protein